MMNHKEEDWLRRNVAFKQMIIETCFDSVSIWSRSDLTDDDKRDWLRNSAENNEKQFCVSYLLHFILFP
jgi:hypothetical protein